MSCENGIISVYINNNMNSASNMNKNIDINKYKNTHTTINMEGNSINNNTNNNNNQMTNANNSQTNKVFVVEVNDQNCSNMASPVEGASPEVQSGGWRQQIVGVPATAGGGQNAQPVPQDISYQGGYQQQQGYAQPGYPQYAQPGYPQYGYPQTGYPQQSGYMQPGYPQQGYGQPGYPQQGYPPSGYPPQGYPQPGYNQQQGYPQQGGNQTVYVVPAQQRQQSNRDWGAFGQQGDVPGPFRKLETPEDRIRFIRGVYSILCCQLIFTFGFVVLVTLNMQVQLYVKGNIWIPYISLGLFLSCFFAFCCCSEKLMSTNAFSISILCVLTLGQTGMLGYTSCHYQPRVVLLALGITLILTLSLTMIACICPVDFTKFHEIAIVIGWLFVLLLIAGIFLTPYMPILHIIIAWAGAVIMSGYIIIDTQVLMSGKRYSLTPDMTIFGAINLYLDIINLFIYILQLVNEYSDN